MRSHRQLFPTSSLPTNDSVCPDHLCLNPDCPFGDCSPYPDPPSSSLIPPPPTSDQAFQISPLVIVVIALISALVILISYYFIALRKRTPPVRRNAPEENTQIESQLDGENDDDQRLVDHHIWLINTVGLQQSVINTITVVKYRRGEGLIEGTDCSVCLSEFREGEILRLLPKCNHAFHVGCIDTWLRSHTNCPMCRAYIVVSGIPGPSLASSDWSFGNLRRNEIDRVIDPEISEVELSNNDDVNEEFVGLGVDLNDQNKSEMSSEDGMKVVRRCVSMGYINSCAFIVLGDSGGLMPVPSWRFIKPLQGNEVSMRRCSSSGARLHDIHVRDSLLTK